MFPSGDERMGKVLHLPPGLPSSAVLLHEDAPDAESALAEIADTIDGVAPEVIGSTLAVQQRESGRWKIDDRPLAEWALRKLGEAQIRLDEDRRLYDQFRARLDEWFDDLTRGHRATISFMTNHLEDYGRRWRATSGSKATLALPAGAVKTKTTKAKAVIGDADVVLAWAKEHEPTLVHSEVKEWVLVSEIRDFVEVMVDVDQNDDGEMITGSVVVHRMTRVPVPGMIVQAEHVDVTVVPEAP